MGKIIDIIEEITDYIENSGFDPGLWAVEHMTEEIERQGYETIEDMDPDDFIDLLKEHDGKVANAYGDLVDYSAAMQLADREICEALNGPNLNTQQKYFEAYAEVHELKYGEKFAPYWRLAW